MYVAIFCDLVSVHISSVNVILFACCGLAERNSSTMCCYGITILSCFTNAVYTHALYTDVVLVKTVQEHVYFSCVYTVKEECWFVRL